MSFAPTLHKILAPGPLGTGKLGSLDLAYDALKPKTPPTAPGVPNPNDAANAAQGVTDQMRARRGLLSNIYAGANSAQPAVGKTTLGT